MYTRYKRRTGKLPDAKQMESIIINGEKEDGAKVTKKSASPNQNEFSAPFIDGVVLFSPGWDLTNTFDKFGPPYNKVISDGCREFWCRANEKVLIEKHGKEAVEQCLNATSFQDFINKATYFVFEGDEETSSEDSYGGKEKPTFSLANKSLT